MKFLDEILKQKEKVFTSTGENVKIDSIMIEKDGEVAMHFYRPDGLHELRSLSKVMIALAYGIAIDRQTLGGGVFANS